MQTLRSRKLTTITLLSLGLAIAMQWFASHVVEQPRDLLTEWLLTFAEEQQSDQARAKLRDISREQSGHEGVIRLASEIMVQHPELFRIPIDESASDEDVHVALLIQWNLHTQASGMDTLQIERTRTLAAPVNDGNSRNWMKAGEQVIDRTVAALRSALPSVSRLADILLLPFKFSIAINAP